LSVADDPDDRAVLLQTFDEQLHCLRVL
jgi:hypothetical protein